VSDADTLRFDIVDQILLVVHADMPPSPTDWARLLVVRDANRLKLRGTLVIAPPRASIDATQRADVATFMKETGTAIVVMTDSVLIRGLARAIGVFGVKVQAFPLKDVAGALDFLSVPRVPQKELVRRIDALKAQLASIRTVG